MDTTAPPIKGLVCPKEIDPIYGKTFISGYFYYYNSVQFDDITSATYCICIYITTNIATQQRVHLPRRRARRVEHVERHVQQVRDKVHVALRAAATRLARETPVLRSGEGFSV